MITQVQACTGNAAGGSESRNEKIDDGLKIEPGTQTSTTESRFYGAGNMTVHANKEEWCQPAVRCSAGRPMMLLAGTVLPGSAEEEDISQ